jgi:cytochrome P450
MLSFPREDRGPLRGWSLAILAALEPAPTASMLDAGNRAVVDFVAYLKDLIAHRRLRQQPVEPRGGRPAGQGHDDVLANEIA